MKKKQIYSSTSENINDNTSESIPQMNIKLFDKTYFITKEQFNDCLKHKEDSEEKFWEYVENRFK